MRLLILLLLAGLSRFSSAQTSPCNDFRFLEIIFAETTRTQGVQYGQNTTIGGTSQDLLLDIYEPQGDTLSRRIPLILAAGGAFSGGDRSDLEPLSRNLAQRGYVVFAIDTRPFDLTLDGTTTEEQLLDWMFKAATDVKAAVRFVRQQTASGNPYGVNPQLIFCGGAGTGALAANHAAMVGPEDNVGPVFSGIVSANGGWEGNSNDITDQTSAVRGVISYSGGLVDASWLGADGPLFIAFHNNSDPEIPFNSGFFAPEGNTTSLTLSGSNLLAQEAASQELFHRLITDPDSGHLSYLTGAAGINNTAAVTAAFVHQVNCEDIVSNLLTFETVDRPISVFPNPTDNFISVRTDANQRLRSIEVFDHSGRRVLVSGQGHTINVSSLEQGTYFLVAAFWDDKISRPLRWVKR